MFTSRRERRLWLWVVVTVVAIYVTLGLAGSLAGLLGDEGLLAAAFFLAMLLIGAAILTTGVQVRPRGIEIGVAAGIAAVYLLLVLRMGIPRVERTHLIEYGVVAFLIYEALAERAANGRPVPFGAMLAILTTALVGALDESIQAVLPNRVFDIRDIGFNSLAGLMAVVARVALG